MTSSNKKLEEVKGTLVPSEVKGTLVPSRKRKLDEVSGTLDSSEVPSKVPYIPNNKDKRIIGEKYMTNNGLRIWDGENLCCEHGELKPASCKLCYDPMHNCEKCSVNFWSTSEYNKHLKLESHLFTPDELINIKRERGKKCGEIGDSVEEYIESKLQLNPNIEFLISTGNTGNKFDTIFKFRDEKCYRGIQTKRLGKRKHRNGYKLSCSSSYEDDTILTGTNLESNVYYVIPWSVIKHLSGGVNFSFNGKLKDYMYNDEEKFVAALFNGIKTTSIILNNDVTNYLTEGQKMEYYSAQRLHKVCEDVDLVYRKKETSCGYINCFYQ